MAIAVENKDENNNEDQGEIIREWLTSIQRSLDFIYANQPQDLSITDALSGYSKIKVYDPYCSSEEPPLKNKIKLIESDKPRRPVGLTGAATLLLTTGEEIRATWRAGRREGTGFLFGPRLEKLGVNHITGYYQNGVLNGRGKLFMIDTTVREGWFQQGYVHGPIRGLTLDGQLDYAGWYTAGIPSGYSWKNVRGGGWLVGNVDEFGQFSGMDIGFIYPDLKTALYGEFCEGKLVSARPAVVVHAQLQEDSVLVPSFQITSEKIYKRWISTEENIACPPHLADPYESSLVQVKQSGMDGAGEGLFAKVDIPEGVIVAYYNGLRFNAGDRMKEDETGYAIFVEHNARVDKHAKHMDIPSRYHSSQDYSATLAHKLNHRFSPNCLWDNAEHPVHGLVPAVRTMVAVSAGEELTIHYQLDMERAPDWYADEWEKHSCASPTFSGQA